MQVPREIGILDVQPCVTLPGSHPDLFVSLCSATARMFTARDSIGGGGNTRIVEAPPFVSIISL